MEQVPALCLFFALSVLLACAEVENVLSLNANPPLENGLSWTFYKCNCPKLESIVQKRIRFYLKKDITQAAGLLRLHFHACFVQGCDASVLLDGSASRASKKEAPPNLMLRQKAFEVIDDIKEPVDKACGVNVSCADITALPARDSVSGAFVRAWYGASRKPLAILLVPTNKKFVLNNLVFQGRCQTVSIFKLNGMKAGTQNLERGKSTNKCFQFAKLESLTLVGGGHINEHGEKLWADLCKRFKKQRSVATVETVVKGRKLLGPTKPNPHPGSPAHHH